MNFLSVLKPSPEATESRVEAARSHLDLTEREYAERKRRYQDAIGRSAASDASDTLEARRLHKMLRDAEDRRTRARDGLEAAARHHAEAQVRAAHAATAARWNHITELQAKRAASAATFQSAAEAVAKARRAFEDDSRVLWDALLPEALSQSADARTQHVTWTRLSEIELERADAIYDPRKGAGMPKAPTIAKAVADLDAMARGWREAALADAVKAA